MGIKKYLYKALLLVFILIFGLPASAFASYHAVTDDYLNGPSIGVNFWNTTPDVLDYGGYGFLNIEEWAYFDFNHNRWLEFGLTDGQMYSYNGQYYHGWFVAQGDQIANTYYDMKIFPGNNTAGTHNYKILTNGGGLWFAYLDDHYVAFNFPKVPFATLTDASVGMEDDYGTTTVFSQGVQTSDHRTKYYATGNWPSFSNSFKAVDDPYILNLVYPYTGNYTIASYYY